MKTISIADFKFEMIEQAYPHAQFLAMNKKGEWFVSTCGMRSYYNSSSDCWADDCNYGRVFKLDTNKTGFNIEKLNEQYDYKNTVLMKRTTERYWENLNGFRDLYAELNNPIKYELYDTSEKKFNFKMPTNFYYDTVTKQVFEFEFQTDSRYFEDVAAVERIAERYGFDLKKEYYGHNKKTYRGVIDWSKKYESEDHSTLMQNIKNGDLFQDYRFDNDENTWFVKIGQERFMFRLMDNYYEKFKFYNLVNIENEVSTEQITQKLKKQKGRWSFINIDFDLSPYYKYMQDRMDLFDLKWMESPESAIRKKGNCVVVVFSELDWYLLDQKKQLEGHAYLKDEFLRNLSAIGTTGTEKEEIKKNYRSMWKLKSLTKELQNTKEIDDIIRARDEANKSVSESERKLKAYHKQNKELAELAYPEILNAIQKEVFDKGLCYKASYEWLSYASKDMGPHYQLRPLGEIVKFDKKKEETFEDCTVHKMEQCDNDVFQIRIIDRYFSKHYPNYELLKKELKIEL